MEGINEALKKVWDVVPEDLKKSEEYEFYVGNGWENVPGLFEGKRVIVCYIIDPFKIYYCYSLLYNDN